MCKSELATVCVPLYNTGGTLYSDIFYQSYTLYCGPEKDPKKNSSLQVIEKTLGTKVSVNYTAYYMLTDLDASVGNEDGKCPFLNIITI